jgi:hypothetical protein
MQLNVLIQWFVSAGGGATLAAAAESKSQKRAFTEREVSALLSASTVGGDLGE